MRWRHGPQPVYHRRKAAVLGKAHQRRKIATQETTQGFTKLVDEGPVAVSEVFDRFFIRGMTDRLRAALAHCRGSIWVLAAYAVDAEYFLILPVQTPAGLLLDLFCHIQPELLSLIIGPVFVHGQGTQVHGMPAAEFLDIIVYTQLSIFAFPSPIHPAAFDRIAFGQGIHALHSGPFAWPLHQVLLAAVREDVARLGQQGGLVHDGSLVIAATPEFLPPIVEASRLPGDVAVEKAHEVRQRDQVGGREHQMVVIGGHHVEVHVDLPEASHGPADDAID